MLVGVDTGGTFTDLVAAHDGGLTLAKVPSTAPDFERGVIEALRAAGLSGAEIQVFAHGTTATTNALLTKSGARTALVTTRGFRDILELRRHDREELYDILWDPPPPLVSRLNRLEVLERVNYAGEVLTPLDEQEARRLARTIESRGFEAVAIVFLHSYVNPSHEKQMRQIVEGGCRGVYVVTSSDLLREAHEFERTATTVANAYLGPTFRNYISGLRSRLSADGYAGSLFVMHSGGGLLPADSMERVPVRTIASGPAAGAVAAAKIAETVGRRNVISMDMGGTSCDIATVTGGQLRLRHEFSPEFGLPIRFPTVDLVTIGAGGGSIAWIDQAGYPKVGPQSAGAIPGPAAYGLGGRDPTVTDANLVLGRFSPDGLLAGTLKLDANLALRAVRRIGDRLGLSPEEAAAGIVRIANSTMSKGIRVLTIERGLDPREFSLVAFGGAGPMHGVELALELEIPEVIVPPNPGVTSALGLLFADVVHDFAITVVRPLASVDPGELSDGLAQLEENTREALSFAGFPAEQQLVERAIDVRYVGQVRALTLAVPGRLTSADLDVLQRLFYSEYERRYHYVTRDIPLETAALRIRGTGLSPRPSFGRTRPEPRAASFATASVYFDGRAVPTKVYHRDALHSGAELRGPALVEQVDATTVVPPGCRFLVDEVDNMVIDLRGRFS